MIYQILVHHIAIRVTSHDHRTSCRWRIIILRWNSSCAALVCLLAAELDWSVAVWWIFVLGCLMRLEARVFVLFDYRRWVCLIFWTEALAACELYDWWWRALVFILLVGCWFVTLLEPMWWHQWSPLGLLRFSEFECLCLLLYPLVQILIFICLLFHCNLILLDFAMLCFYHNLLLFTYIFTFFHLDSELLKLLLHISQLVFVHGILLTFLLSDLQFSLEFLNQKFFLRHLSRHPVCWSYDFRSYWSVLSFLAWSFHRPSFYLSSSAECIFA